MHVLRKHCQVILWQSYTSWSSLSNLMAWARHSYHIQQQEAGTSQSLLKELKQSAGAYLELLPLLGPPHQLMAAGVEGEAVLDTREAKLPVDTGAGSIPRMDIDRKIQAIPWLPWKGPLPHSKDSSHWYMWAVTYVCSSHRYRFDSLEQIAFN